MSTTQELRDLPAQYDPGRTERAVYQRWVEAGIFSADEKRSRRNGGDRDPFVIVMPPPNVTAVLHMGHGLNNTVQDVIVRWRRMVGDEALWVPGTDHAGIATQNIIEKQLATEGKTKADLGREVRGRENQSGPRARGVRRAHHRLRRRNRRRNPAPAARDRRVGGLESHRLHLLARAFARSARSI